MRIVVAFATGLFALVPGASAQQTLPSAPVPPPAAQASQSTTKQAVAQSSQPSSRITLDEALRLSLQHNHALLALRSTILQSQAMEITANLRPNPVLAWDAQFLPIFNPSNFNNDYLDNSAQFDAGVSYLFERGKKRQHRLRAAQDATTVIRSQVSDSERQLAFNVAQQFISVVLAESTCSLPSRFDSFQKQGHQCAATMPAISVKATSKSSSSCCNSRPMSPEELARVQALAGLRQFLGFESVPDDYDVTRSRLSPENAALTDLKSTANRAPDRSPRNKRHRRAKPGSPGCRQPQAGSDRRRHLHAYRRTQHRCTGLQHSAAGFRSQSGRNRANSLRHHSSPGTSQRNRAASRH
jgi:cobalt-zinc-cadmium efflux system outer membrane protein